MTTMLLNHERVVTIERVLRAAPKKLWRYFVEPELMKRWGGGESYDFIAIDADVRPGGVLHQRVATKDGTRRFTFHGVYFEIEEARRLVHTFEWKDDWREPADPSLVTILFEERDQSTALTIRHEGLTDDAAESSERHWSEFLGVLESTIG